MKVDEIKSRGHWIVRMYPVVHNERRFDRTSLLMPVIAESSVSLRGWDFPHISIRPEDTKTNQDSIEQSVEWNMYSELWRFHLSGQFIFIGALWGEWRDRIGGLPPLQDGVSVLFVSDVIVKWTETLLLARRLMEKMSLNEIKITVSLNKIQDRQLYVPPANRMPFAIPKVCRGTDTFELSYVLDLGQLQTSLAQIALEESRRTFNLFDNWDPALDFLQGFQKEQFGNKI